MNKEISRDIQKGATTYYGIRADRDKYTAMLCSLCKEMTPEQMEKIIYNARNPVSRELATWWEHHQEVDRKREEKERQDAERQELVKSALAKLTPAEVKALGLNKPQWPTHLPRLM